MYSFFDLLNANLTSYTTTELWITRFCLFMAVFVIAPTLTLIVLDFFLWCFRTGEVSSKHLLKRSRSGIDLMQQAVAARRSSGSSEQPNKGIKSTGFAMTPTQSSSTTHKTAAATSMDKTNDVSSEAIDDIAMLRREDTDPVGGVSNTKKGDASIITLGRVLE